MRETTIHTVLAPLIESASYRPGWRFEMNEDDDGVCTFGIVSKGFDTHHVDRGETYRVYHPFLVPPATYNEASWKRWILDRIVDVETHEACEFFRVDGKLPFPPNHGPGWQQYGIREVSRIEDAETTARGIYRSGSQS